MKSRTSQKRIWEILFWLGNIILWGLVYWKQCYVNNAGDFEAHNLFAELIVEGKMVLMYPGYHYLVGYPAALLGLETTQTSIVVLVLAQIASIYVTTCLLKEITDDWKDRISLLISAFLLNIIQPVFTFNYILGPNSGNGLVSPTLTACKPFVLLSILLFYRIYAKKQWTVKNQAALAVVLVISCLIKPLFAMAFVPAMGLLLFADEVAAIAKKEKRFWNAAGQYLVRCIPLIIAGIVLILQFVYSLISEAPEGAFEGIRVSADKNTHIRFGYMHAWSMVVPNVYINILMAYLFPLAVLLVYLYYKYWVKNTALTTFGADIRKYAKICAFYAVVSFAYISCLYQDNGYETDLNFRNSWVVTFNLVYCLAFVVFRSWIQKKNEKGIRKNIELVMIAAVFGIQLLFGLALIAKNILL